MHDVMIIGAGVIGLSVARELSRRNSVAVLERGKVGQGTSWAAAGMLSPQSEADEAGPFFELCRSSLQMFPAWIRELESESGVDSMYARDGLLSLATSAEEMAVFARRADWQKRAGLQAEVISPDDARSMEPLITAPIAGALYLPGESSVAPRLLLRALEESCLRRGVEFRTETRVDRLSQLEARSIVVASGVWSAQLTDLDPPIPVYPRKGQILSLAAPPGSFRRMIRWRHSYFVPRLDGELVVGATNEDAGFERRLTPAGLGRLLSDAQAMSSHAGSWPIQETWTGLRPATADELPILGASAASRVYYATGHYRNGVLLAPVTAAIMSDLLATGSTRVDITPYSPHRFSKNDFPF
jgi:glycine oxidase